jgi:phytanoyl-CoA dioxygenase PhyH
VRRDEVARFRRDGFVAVDRAVVGPAALGKVRALLDALFARADELPRPWVHDLAPGTHGGFVPEIVKCAHIEPRLLKTRAYAVAARSARVLLGGPVELAFDHAIFKPVGSDATALHQDLAFSPDGREVAAVKMWLALVDATESNGCMRFLASTPPGLMAHEAVGRDGRAAIGVDTAAVHTYPVRAGGFTAHSPRTVHGSGPNRGPGVRAAWILDFVRDDRSWRRRTWERSLELRGIVLPRRAAETREASLAGEAATGSADPGWVAPPD